MNEDIESVLKQLTPRGAAPEVRARVLDAVAECLADAPDSLKRNEVKPRSRWVRWLPVGVAAASLLGVALNGWAARSGTTRLAAIYGPTPEPRYLTELVETIVSVTDAQTGERVRQQFASIERRRAMTLDEVARHYQTMLDTILLVEKELRHDTTQEDTEMDRHRLRDPAGGASYRQRRLGYDLRCTV